jgi:hypothetical protein
MNATTPNSINLAHGHVLRWPTRRSRAWTAGFLRSASKDTNVLAVIAVGSAVRPKVPSADLDLVVICRDPAILDRAHPPEVDLRAYPANTVEPEIERGNDILGWAVRFGQILHQKGFYWGQIVNSWRDRLPIPSPVLARSRAMEAHRYLADMIRIGDLDAAREQALSYLTHLARAELLEKGIYPASRPELPEQLRRAGSSRLAIMLAGLQTGDLTDLSQIDGLGKPLVHASRRSGG